MNLFKTITIDGYYDKDEANNISSIVEKLDFVETRFGEIIPNFNMISHDIDDLFSKVLNFNIVIDKEMSGVFVKPKDQIHFESLQHLSEWIFLVALKPAKINFYDINDEKLVELCNIQLLKPGQGIFFRPWLIYSINSELIQLFKLSERY